MDGHFWKPRNDNRVRVHRNGESSRGSPGLSAPTSFEELWVMVRKQGEAERFLEDADPRSWILRLFRADDGKRHPELTLL